MKILRLIIIIVRIVVNGIHIYIVIRVAVIIKQLQITFSLTCYSLRKNKWRYCSWIRSTFLQIVLPNLSCCRLWLARRLHEPYYSSLTFLFIKIHKTLWRITYIVCVAYIFHPHVLFIFLKYFYSAIKHHVHCTWNCLYFPISCPLYIP